MGCSLMPESILRRRALRVAAGATAGRVLGVGGFSVLASSAASAGVVFGRGDTRVALLVPSATGAYRRASAAIVEGVRAAHARDGQGVRVEVFELDGENTDMAGLFARLERLGVTLAIGPMTRDSVNRLASLAALPVPTLTLNLPDAGQPVPRNCVLFGLPIEVEARQAARVAYEDLLGDPASPAIPRALAIAEDNPLARRSAEAFLDGWRDLGGESYQSLVLRAEAFSELPRIVRGVVAQAVFVAVSPTLVTSVRGALGPRERLYATSMMNTGALAASKVGGLLAMPELDGMRIVDMPWQVDPENPLVRQYPRSEKMPHQELQRLYALGIDAYRIARELLAGRTAFDVDGVTGRLQLDGVSPRIARVGVVAEYRKGLLVPVPPR